MIVIPAVDIREGRCVRLEQGRAERETVYGDDPVAAARRWADGGAERIHVVDLDGAFGEDRSPNLDIVRRLIAAVDVPVEVGGGVRSRERAETLLDAGAARVIVGTRAIEDRAFLDEIAAAHPGRINLGLDARGGRLAVRGWTETSPRLAVDLVETLAEVPLGEVIYTDIATDGMLAGPNLAEIAAIQAASPHPVIASGGIASAADVVALAQLGLFGAITGKALYDGRLTLAEALAAAGAGL